LSIGVSGGIRRFVHASIVGEFTAAFA